ncbi:MAG TPA: ABC transporter ATP-binding protein [Dehalococcoidia bacterium]
MSDAFVQCKGLTKRFGDTTAVDDVTLEIEHGQTLALLGPSGCGKTTLLRLISGFERPDAGTISIGGVQVAGGGKNVAPEKRRVGMVFQDYALFPHLSVRDNIAFGMRGNGRKERVERLLAGTGLAGLGSRMPQELSGGQQQRVALARSLAAGPHVMLLDEPFSNLDPELRHRLREAGRAILESLQMTAIFVSHDQEEALSLSGRLAIMMDGRVQQVGSPSEVYNYPATRAVASFLGDANFLPGECSGGRLQFELGSVDANSDLSGAVEVMVRPERLKLDGEAGIPVEVVHADYFGHDQLATVRLPSGNSVKVRLQPGGEFEAGARTNLSLAGDVVLFPA